MSKRVLTAAVGVVAAGVVASACSAAAPAEPVPGMAPRGTAMTTVTPTHQDLTDSVSLTGTVDDEPRVRGRRAGGRAGPLPHRQGARPHADRGDPGRRGVAGRQAALGRGARRRHVRRPAHRRPGHGAPPGCRSRRRSSPGTASSPRSTANRRTGSRATSRRYERRSTAGPARSRARRGARSPRCRRAPCPNRRPPSRPAAAAPAGAPSGVAAPPPDTAAEQPAPEEAVPDGSEATGLRLVCTAPAGVRLINGAAATLEVVTARRRTRSSCPWRRWPVPRARQGRGRREGRRPPRWST